MRHPDSRNVTCKAISIPSLVAFHFPKRPQPLCYYYAVAMPLVIIKNQTSCHALSRGRPVPPVPRWRRGHHGLCHSSLKIRVLVRVLLEIARFTSLDATLESSLLHGRTCEIAAVSTTALALHRVESRRHCLRLTHGARQCRKK